MTTTEMLLCVNMILLGMVAFLSLTARRHLTTKTRKILQAYTNRQGHDKCHYNPEVLDSLLDLYHVKCTRPNKLPLKSEFDAECDIYSTRLYGSECPGNNGTGEPCCERAGQYNGYGSDGPFLFHCPRSCSCHD